MAASSFRCESTDTLSRIPLSRHVSHPLSSTYPARSVPELGFRPPRRWKCKAGHLNSSMQSSSSTNGPVSDQDLAVPEQVKKSPCKRRETIRGDFSLEPTRGGSNAINPNATVAPLAELAASRPRKLRFADRRNCFRSSTSLVCVLALRVTLELNVTHATGPNEPSQLTISPDHVRSTLISAPNAADTEGV